MAELFGRHREVHPYGLADLEEPLWSRSTWHVDGDAAIGILDLGSGAPVLYAVSADADTATLALLERLAPELPDHFVITGPTGLADRLAGAYTADWVIPHVKMHLTSPERLLPIDSRVAWLDRSAVADIVELRAQGDDASAFFIPELLDTGYYAGIRVEGGLAAVTGVHVVSERFGVAAIGNVLTHPAHRRQGLARALVTTVARRLLDTVPTVGLNVGVANVGARRLYEEVGFMPVVAYEEAELRLVH